MIDFDFSKVMHPCTMRAPMHPMEDDAAKVHLSAMAQCVQTHRCNKYCKPGAQHTKCRFGYPRPLSNESTIQTVFRNEKTKLVVSPARNNSRVNAHNPSVLSCWGANMDVQILLDAYGAAVYTASYLTKHEKSRLAPRILYHLSKNARNRTVKQMVRTVLLSVLSTREVSIQEVLWIRTGKKFCCRPRGSRPRSPLAVTALWD